MIRVKVNKTQNRKISKNSIKVFSFKISVKVINLQTDKKGIKMQITQNVYFIV